MDEMRDLESLRETARALRHEADEAMLDRVRASVRARIAVPASPWEILAGWLRPAAISLAAIVALFVAAFSLATEPISPDEMAAMTGRILIEREAPLVVP